MEKITIISIEANPTMAGKQRWKCIDDMAREFGVWDKDMANRIMGSLNKLAMVSISQIKDDKGNVKYNNIVTFEPITGELENAMEITEKVTTTVTGKPLLSAIELKDMRIASLCMLKCANEYVCSLIASNDVIAHDQYGKMLGSAINELTGAYHLAFNNLQTGE